MDLLSCLFIFSPTEKNKKFTNVFTRNISELAALKLVNVVTKETYQILLQTLALTETANKFRPGFEGTHSPMQDTISVKLKAFSVVLIDIVYFELVYC